MTSFEFIVFKWIQNTCKWSSFTYVGKTCANSRNDRIGGVKGGLQKFELVISTDILTKNLNSKYMSQYIHYIAICLIKTHYANTHYINMQSHLNTLHRIWVICVYSGYMWDKYVLWAAVNDMAAPYGGSHDGRKSITPHYVCDSNYHINFIFSILFNIAWDNNLSFKLSTKSLHIQYLNVFIFLISSFIFKSQFKLWIKLIYENI